MPAGPKQVSVGGAADSFVADAVNKIPEGSLVILAGLADVIPSHFAGNYIANNAGGAEQATLGAPTAGDSLAGGDDGKIIRFTAGSAFAHKITSTGNLQTGTGSVNSVAVAAFAGASVTLMAFNGKWMIIGSNAALTLA